MIIELRARDIYGDFEFINSYDTNNAEDLQQMAYQIADMARHGLVPVIDEQKGDNK